MNIGGIGGAGYPAWYQTGRTGRNSQNAEAANRAVAAQSAGQAGGSFVLHMGSGVEGDILAGAGCGDGYSYSAFEPADFDPSNPVYKVVIWNADGTTTERMVDVDDVDLQNCDFIDMFACAGYLSRSGRCPEAQSALTGAGSNQHGPDERTYDDLFHKRNWVGALRYAMQNQYELGNLQGYMHYKKAWDFFGEQEWKDKAAREREEDADTQSDVIVRPDGSRVLVVTTNIGGSSTTMSLKISEATDMPNEAAKMRKEEKEPEDRGKSKAAGLKGAESIKNNSMDRIG